MASKHLLLRTTAQHSSVISASDRALFSAFKGKRDRKYLKTCKNLPQNAAKIQFVQTDDLWNCTSSFSDPLLARALCPFKKENCGDRPQILLNNTGDNVDIDINLPHGGSCMLEMRAQCGIPSFKPNNTDGLDI